MTTDIESSAPGQAAEVTPQCQVGALYPDFEPGCSNCRSPGYQHPVLGWMLIPCACPHHTAEAS